MSSTTKFPDAAWLLPAKVRPRPPSSCTGPRWYSACATWPCRWASCLVATRWWATQAASLSMSGTASAGSDVGPRSDVLAVILVRAQMGYNATMRYVVAMAALLMLSAGVARGDDQGTARDHYIKGTRAYELGLYDEAIAEYMAAYKTKDDPALLFNLGQAHRLAGHATEALHFYKTYLAKGPQGANRADVESEMRELKELVEKQRQAQAEPPAVSGASNLPAGVGTVPPEPAPGMLGGPTDVGVGSNHTAAAV